MSDGLHSLTAGVFLLSNFMARKERNNVDYFPHAVTHGRKMFYLRTKFKNDGYAVWFMLLEHIGKAEYHYLDLSEQLQIMYLSSEFMVSEETLLQIVDTLVHFGEFDRDCWESFRILYNQKFIDNIQDAYKKRNNVCIDKKSLLTLLSSKGILNGSLGYSFGTITDLKGDGNTHSKVKYTIEEETIEDKNKFLLSDTPTGVQTKKPKNKFIETFDLRKESFRESLKPFTKYNRNPEGLYDADTVKNFFEYWTEPNKSRSKMRWETEKTWDLSKRIQYWTRNQKEFSKNDKNIPNANEVYTQPKFRNNQTIA